MVEETADPDVAAKEPRYARRLSDKMLTALHQPLRALNPRVLEIWVVTPCRRRQPSKAVAKGQRLQGATTQTSSAHGLGCEPPMPVQGRPRR
jgi:hypothetical protein